MKKFLKATQKGQKYKCQFTTFKMDFFEKFLHFWNPQVWVSYWNFNIKVVGSLLFLALMLWWAQCIFDWVGFIGCAEARLRLRQNFWAWSDPKGSREYPHEVWWYKPQYEERYRHISPHYPFQFRTLYMHACYFFQFFSSIHGLNLIGYYVAVTKKRAGKTSLFNACTFKIGYARLFFDSIAALRMLKC